MKGETFTIGELAERITGGNERAARALLRYDGGAADLDLYAENPAETVSRDVVIALAAHRAGDRVGNHAARLLGETMGGRDHANEND